MKRLLIVAHTPSPNTRALLDAVIEGARDDAIEGVEVITKAPLESGPEDLRPCDGLLLGTTENLGYMSGALKDFFDRSYYPVLEEKQGLPFGFWIRAGHDGTGTRRAIESITTGLRWRAVLEPLVMRGSFDADFLGQARELGLSMAAGLDAGIY